MELVKASVILFLIDLLWLSTGGVYAQKMTEKIQGSPVHFRYIGALFVYLALGYLLLQVSTDTQAFLYGMAVYAVYDFTNFALLKDYDIRFALADTLWGGILFVAARRLLLAL